MEKRMVCIDCGKQFTGKTENVNSAGMVLDVQCECGSYEVNIAEGEIITPLHKGNPI